MDSSLKKHNWWIILIVGSVLAIAAFFAQQKWLPENDLAGLMMVAVLLGGAFFWVYSLDRQGFWWALIPAMAMAALLITVIVGYITPKDASGSSPYGVITLGLCVAIMGMILKRPSAKFVLYAIAIITLLVGILMLPIGLIWKILLIVIDVLLIGALIAQTTRQAAKA